MDRQSFDGPLKSFLEATLILNCEKFLLERTEVRDWKIRDGDGDGLTGSDLYQFSPGDNHLLRSIIAEKTSGGPIQAIGILAGKREGSREVRNRGARDGDWDGPIGSDLYQFPPGDNHLFWNITAERTSGGQTQTTLNINLDAANMMMEEDHIRPLSSESYKDLRNNSREGAGIAENSDGLMGSDLYQFEPGDNHLFRNITAEKTGGDPTQTIKILEGKVRDRYGDGQSESDLYQFSPGDNLRIEYHRGENRRRNCDGPTGSDLYQFSPGDNHPMRNITAEKTGGGPTQIFGTVEGDISGRSGEGL
ncbi:unnamed protein product [Caenorhabditis nigoni]